MSLPVLLILAVVSSGTPTEGAYRVRQDRTTVEKEVWGLFCGASKPPGDSRGKTVQLQVKDGEWTVSGSGRKFGTATCEGDNPSLAPVKRSKRGNTIVLKCKSRRVTRGTEETEHELTLRTDGSIRLRTISKRYFRMQGDDCRSTSERITVVAPKNKPTSTTTTEHTKAPTTPADSCEKPGPPKVLVISPKVFDAKVGGAPACLELTAKDANGCHVPVTNLKWAVDPAGSGKVNAKNCFSPSKTLKKEEAVAVIAKLTTSTGVLEAAATARVVPAKEKRATKSLAQLAKTTRSKRAKALLAEVTRGEIILRPLQTDPPEMEPLEPPPFPILPVVGAALLFIFALFILVVVLVRKKKQPKETELQAKPVVTPKKGGGLVCPKCKFEFAVGEAATCPFDGEALEELGRDARQTMFVPTAGGMICPVCKTKYPTKARFCGHDRSPLLPDFGQFNN